MRRIDKSVNSKIIKAKLEYKINSNNSKLARILCDEQHNICAYTETYLGRSDKKDIDHFDPTLRGQVADSYENWFLIKAQWNSEKSNKWAAYQPVLHPTSTDFEQRIIYVDGEYYPASGDDIEAVNLIRLLKLDDVKLADMRKRYVARIRETITWSGKINQKFIDDLLLTDRDALYFIRAIEQELNVRVDFDLLKTT